MTVSDCVSPSPKGVESRLAPPSKSATAPFRRRATYRACRDVTWRARWNFGL